MTETTSSSPLTVLFDNPTTVREIQRKLPMLFWLANEECMRGGVLGQEVGKIREKIVTVMLINKLSRENVKISVPTTYPEANVIVKQVPVSILTLTVKDHFSGAGVKINWSANSVPAHRFVDTYPRPKSDILFVLINFSGTGKLVLIPINVQSEILQKMGRHSYFKAPSVSETSKGVEFKPSAMLAMLRHRDTKSIDIPWHRAAKASDPFYPYKRWYDAWNDEALYPADGGGGGDGKDTGDISSYFG